MDSMMVDNKKITFEMALLVRAVIVMDDFIDSYEGDATIPFGDLVEMKCYLDQVLTKENIVKEVK